MGRVGIWGWRRGFQKAFISLDGRSEACLGAGGPLTAMASQLAAPATRGGAARPREELPGGPLWSNVPTWVGLSAGRAGSEPWKPEGLEGRPASGPGVQLQSRTAGSREALTGPSRGPWRGSPRPPAGGEGTGPNAPPPGPAGPCRRLTLPVLLRLVGQATAPTC